MGNTLHSSILVSDCHAPHDVAHRPTLSSGSREEREGADPLTSPSHLGRSVKSNILRTSLYTSTAASKRFAYAS